MDTTTRSFAKTTATASWQALGTSAVLRVADRAALPEAEAAVRAELEAIDLACSRFRPDSELSQLNADAGVARRRRVSPLLFEALALALRAAELTGGKVDPTVGRALVLAGYDRDWSLLTPPPRGAGQACGQAPPRIAARQEGWRAVRLVRHTERVHVPAGIQIDLGATAKAWAADRCATAATAATGTATILALGGDIATAGEAPGQGWSVLVTDDHRSTGEGQRIAIRSGGIATSSTTVRRWMHEGREMHHIIDPVTGEPALSAWRTVSVAAGDCADANIAATAAILLSHSAPEWLESRGLPARLVAQRSGTAQTVGGWPCDRHAGETPRPARHDEAAAPDRPAHAPTGIDTQRREAA